MSAWYDDRANLALLARYMEQQGDSVDDVAYMLEKPWKFEDEWRCCADANRLHLEVARALVVPAAAKLQSGDLIRIIDGGWELVDQNCECDCHQNPTRGCWCGCNDYALLRQMDEAFGMTARCRHCGKFPDADGDHSCPCPYTDADCPNHPELCACGCPPDMHVGEVGCPCALPGEAPCGDSDA